MNTTTQHRSYESLAHAANRTCVSIRTLRRRIARGQLAAYRTGSDPAGPRRRRPAARAHPDRVLATVMGNGGNSRAGWLRRPITQSARARCSPWGASSTTAVQAGVIHSSNPGETDAISHTTVDAPRGQGKGRRETPQRLSSAAASIRPRNRVTVHAGHIRT